MRPDELKALLNDIRSGTKTPDDAVAALRRLPTEHLGFAQLDTHRELRQGFPEAIYAESKTADEITAIALRMLQTTSGAVLGTRVPDETVPVLLGKFPDAIHHERARLVVFRAAQRSIEGVVAVVSAGTSDLAVADEAARTVEALGAETRQITDVGVAGLHRLLSVEDRLRTADVVIVVAGMEGALASLVGGLVGVPTIAVPTSVGYGASFDGLAALLAMLNSCAAGITVTNIDNGFGAATAAIRILNGRR